MISGIMRGVDCVFCGIVNGKVPSTKDYEDEYVVAFRDIHPEAPVHVVVVPKRHISSLDTTTEADTELLGRAQRVCAKLVSKLGLTSGYKLNLNGGRYQEVKHIHYHLKGGFVGGGE